MACHGGLETLLNVLILAAHTDRSSVYSSSFFRVISHSFFGIGGLAPGSGYTVE